jgi:3-oxoacyl-[acyl-carrier protein] reductase
MRFQNKNVLVTAASTGIGYDIAASFVREGARVGLNARKEETTIAATKKLNKETKTDKVIPLPADVSDLEQMKQHIDNFCEDGDIDIYVANAGITVFRPFLEVEPDEYDQLMAINLRGTYFTIQHVAKKMITAGTQGRIIIMSSVCGVQSHLNLSAYAMSKAALRQLAKSLAEELGPHGITVNVVGPGATLNERTAEDPEYKAGWKSVTPNRRVGTTADVSHATLFLADDMARHINGEILMVDGGWTVTSPLPSHLMDE